MQTGDPKATSLQEFLDSCTDIHEDTLLSFENVGEVCLTTIARANLALLRRALDAGYKGVIFSCPDFERESLAVTFLGALCHLICDEGEIGIREAQGGMHAAIGDCVLDVIEADDRMVKIRTSRTKVDTGFLRRIWQFPLVHQARSDAELSRMKPSEVRCESERYESIPCGIKLLLDIIGKEVPAVGYVSSPSPYLNEPPIHVPRGRIEVEGDEASLSRALPVTYLSPTGKPREGFEWPFDAPPSVIVSPRSEGTGSAYRLVEYVREGGELDFVSMNLPGPETLDTPLISDIHDLAGLGVGIICFCDRWTLDAVRELKDDGFLLFDWDDCELATRASYPILSPIQWTMRKRHHETVVEVPTGDSGIEETKRILYENLRQAEFRTDEAWQAKQELFRALGSAIRMTEAADKEYSLRMRRTIEASVDDIEASWSLSPTSFSALCDARDLLLKIFEEGNVLPKEEMVYDLITERISARQSVVLVVDRSRTKWVYDYWKSELECNDYSVDRFRVINTKDFMAESGLRGNDRVIFSGWYGRDVMDRALHSGIVADMTFVLYHGESDGLETEWWRRANDRWHRSSDRCARETDTTLAKLGIERLRRAAKAVDRAASDPVRDSNEDRDDSPTSIITEVERRRLQRDVAHHGERAVTAVPIMFDNGSHVWLRADTHGYGSGGRLVVINDCLTGQNDTPEHKPASAVMRGDMVLRTHSSKAYIRKAAQERLDGYEDVMEVAQRWKDPIRAARMQGLSDADIARVLSDHFGSSRNYNTIRGWVAGNRIAPQSDADIRGIFAAFHIYIKDEDVRAIASAASRIRGQHQRTGMMAADKMVRKFIEDVEAYGLEDALAGFDERHESGNVELLTVSGIGERMSVAEDRVEIL